MLCPKCGLRNGANALACAGCSTSLGTACPTCGKPSIPDARFCSSCGNALAVVPASVERRQLTVLFCDMVDSTAFSERLDAEDLRDLLHALHRTCGLAVGSHGGHLSQYLGDGVMAYFGYTRSHEDNAVRAVRAARRILAGVAEMNAGIGRRLQVDIKVRIGLHTGSVIVGEMGPGGAYDSLAVGDTVNIAAHVQALAEADMVLASAATARLVQGYVNLRSQGQRTLKGVSMPMELFEVQAETQARSRLEAAAVRGLTPYVGREGELTVLEKIWREVRGGGERVVFVRGEAGIGKSRLVDRFQQTALQESSTVLKCYCSQLSQATALAPIIDMLERRADEQTGLSTPESRLAALTASLAEHSRFGPDALPLLAALLSLPGVDESALAGMSVAVRRTRTLSVLRTWLGFVAERAPTLLLFEDVHWADSTTLDFIQLLARMGGGRRTLICATGRPETDPAWATEDVARLDLRPMGRAEAEALAVRVAGGKALPAQLAFRIVERSEGVPLFVEEITRAAIESGALTDRGDRYEFTGDLRADVVPAAVTDSLLARFDRLGPSRPVAQLAAAIGRDFNFPLLLATSGLSEVGLRHHLGHICESGLVLREEDQNTFAFKHALVHQAVYGTLLKHERREAHANILTVLKKDFGGWLALHPEAGAHHAEEAGLRREAIDYLRMAGLRALSRTEAHGAARHLTRALELLDAVEEPERSRLELELIGPVSQAYIAVHGYAAPDTLRACERARNLALARGDVAGGLMATNSLCTVMIVRGDLRKARALARELMEAPAVAANPLLRTVALQAECNTLYYSGEFTQALRDSTEALDIFEREKDANPAVRLGAPLTALSWVQAASLAMHGRLDEVPRYLEKWEERQRLYRTLEALPKNAPIVNFTTLAIARASTPLFVCVVLYLVRQTERIPKLAAEALAVSEAERLTLWYSIARMFMAFDAGTRNPDAVRGAADFRSAVAAYQATGSRISLSIFVGMLAELLLAANQPEESLAVLSEEIRRIEGEHEFHFQPELLRLSAKTLEALGRRAEATATYHSAIDAARALGSRLLSLRAATGLYRLAADAPAKALLQQEYDAFSEGHGFPDLKDARALLAL